MLAAGGPESCEAAQELATEKIGELEAKITMLGSMKHSLQTLLATWSRPRRQRECRWLQSIETEAIATGE